MMDVVKYCRACLATDVKMFSLARTSIDSVGAIYSHLAQISINETNQHVCFECASLLYKYHKFRSKCHRAHNILSEINLNVSQITIKDIQSIDRNVNNLASSLIHCPISIDTVTSSIDFQEEVNFEEKFEIKTEKQSNLDTDSKSDFHVYLEEDNIVLSPNKVPQNKISPKVKHKSKGNKKPSNNKKNVEKTDSNNIKIKKRANTNDKASNTKKKNSVDSEHLEDHMIVVNLSSEDARQEVLSKKKSSSFMKLPYKCNMCYKGYGVKAAFENHMKKHNIESGEYECEFCHLRFPRKNFLYKHKFSSHQRKFSCKSCSFVTFCISKAKSHISSHKGKTYPCEDCNEVFSKLNSLVSHRRKKHIKHSLCERVCEHCGCAFGTERGLILHNVMLHRQDKNDKQGPNCEECGVHFASETAWKRHLVLSSKHEISNGCECCGETFSNADELKSHMKVHSRSHITKADSIKLPAPCPICEKWLATISEYKVHVSTQHPHSDEGKRLIAEEHTPFVCEVCGQAFKHRCHLRYHQRKHTGERPYACDVCGKAFPQPAARAAHRAAHGPRAHRCQLCARVFTLKNALNRHIKVHLGIRPHACGACSKRFVHRCELRLHARCAHGPAPWPRKNKRNAEQTHSLQQY